MHLGRPCHSSSRCVVSFFLRVYPLTVSQIRMSPQARAFFHKLCREIGLPELELKKYVRTRWASLFNVLDRFLELQPAVARFIQLADESEEVPTLKGKAYANFRLGKKDWEHLSLIHQVLKVATWPFHYPTY
jgi:hypothetical protein